MKVGIEKSELIRLLNRDTELQLLENGGVDNWDWYGESLKTLDENTVDTIDGSEFIEKYFSGDTVFYNNNPAQFVSYLSSSMAVIVVNLRPNFDESFVYGQCAGCMVGDSDNKLTCTCDESAWIVEEIEAQTVDTLHPLIVDVRMLHDKPMDVIKWEADIKALDDEKKVKKAELKEIAANSIRLRKQIAENEEILAAMKSIDEM